MLFTFFFFLINTIYYIWYDKIPEKYNYLIVPNTCFQQRLNFDKKNNVRIKIYKCNKYLLKKIENYKFNIWKFIKNHNLKNKYLYKYIYILQQFGFINSIHRHMILCTQYKQTIFNIKVNPILKKVNIIHHKQLKIYSKLLSILFKQQLGLPKNYLHIQRSINIIYNWYLYKGYQWTNINIINTPESHEISILIDEGKIYEVNLVCKTYGIKKNIILIN
uniref:POTRA domain-containing protein n=1 Tax=Gracilariopsis lemaneiformis TaxID=2782 RepID=A0A0C5DI27_GRALE|nr:hypothetical protein [Gracilariopsis lemaneiformis]AJO68548.1 hypothetical protein [Gracilariopsis lemaneiformis]AML79821.1 hypothetical protein [Gracilariopsis lemaneiformis]